jgi:alpha-beta hydrolase superfamily lysophospholipase
VVGRETVGTFRNLSFNEQVDLVCADLKEHFWLPDAHVVAVSFGAYLFLHAQARMESYPGNVLLLSPIVGQFGSESIGLGFIPPKAGLLKDLVGNGLFNAPLNCEIHVGSEDWQSNPEAVAVLGETTGMRVAIVSNRGHELGVDYVAPLLDRWLNTFAVKRNI